MAGHPPAPDDLTASYREPFGGRLAFGKRPALIVIDMVRAYFDPLGPLYIGEHGEQVLCNNRKLVAAARSAGIMVAFTNVLFLPGGADGGVFYAKVPALKAFEQGSPLGDFLPGLKPQERDVVITKRYASSFFGTHLASTLTAAGIDTLLIAGVSTSGCVRATALDACQHGFVPYVVRDACGDRHPAPHEANLFDLQAKYAEVVTLDDALRLLGDIASPQDPGPD